MPGYAKAPRDLLDKPEFRALPEDSRTLYLFLLISRHSNSFGYFVIDDAYICADLQWPMDRLEAAWSGIILARYVHRDPEARMVLIVHALELNKPDNVNVSKAWGVLLQALPDSPLRQELKRLAHANLSTRYPWQLGWLTPSDEAHSTECQPPLSTEHPTEYPPLFRIPNPNPNPHPHPKPKPKPEPKPKPKPLPFPRYARKGAMDRQKKTIRNGF